MVTPEAMRNFTASYQLHMNAGADRIERTERVTASPIATAVSAASLSEACAPAAEDDVRIYLESVYTAILAASQTPGSAERAETS